MLYICIYNEETKEIAFPETYPIGTDEEIDWARKNSERLGNECICRLPEKWKNYYSEEGPFEWPKEPKK